MLGDSEFCVELDPGSSSQGVGATVGFTVSRSRGFRALGFEKRTLWEPTVDGQNPA